MSFLIDPPALYAAGEAYARGAPESAQGRAAGFVGAGVVAGILALALRRPGAKEHALVLAALATYPLWYWLGWDHGRRARP